MDAERLVGVSRNVLAGSADARAVLAEAGQAQALAQAIGSRLAYGGPAELRAEARELAEAGERGGGVGPPALRGGAEIRAARLTGVADVRGALTALDGLFDEVGIALVAVACATDEEGLYWQCIEAIDAADETRDRLGGLLRGLDGGAP